MSKCSGCDTQTNTTLELAGVMLCDDCIRRECVREHPPIDERPWLAASVVMTKTSTSTSKDDFAA